MSLARAWSLNLTSGISNSLGFHCGRLSKFMTLRLLESETLDLTNQHFAADVLQKTHICVATWSYDSPSYLAIPLRTSFKILMCFVVEIHSGKHHKSMFRCRGASRTQQFPEHLLLWACSFLIAASEARFFHFWPALKIVSFLLILLFINLVISGLGGPGVRFCGLAILRIYNFWIHKESKRWFRIAFYSSSWSSADSHSLVQVQFCIVIFSIWIDPGHLIQDSRTHTI